MARFARICGVVCCSVLLFAWTFSCFASIRSLWRFGSAGIGVSVRTGYVQVLWLTGNEADRIDLLDHYAPIGVSIEWKIRSSGVWGDTWREHLRAVGLTGITTWSTPAYNNVGVEEVSIPLWMPLLALGAPTLWLCRYRRRRKIVGRCDQCGYDLTGNLSGQCPECGTALIRQERDAGPTSERKWTRS